MEDQRSKTHLIASQLKPGLNDQRQPRIVIVLCRLHTDENVIQFGCGWLWRRCHRALRQIVEQFPIATATGEFGEQRRCGSLTDLNVAKIEAMYVLAYDQRWCNG